MLEIIKYIPVIRLKHYFLTFLPHFTVKKLLNIGKTEINFALKRKKLTSFPYFMLMDSTNICHLRCPLCCTGQRQYARPKGKMKFTTFKKIIDEIGDYLLMIHMVWWGEPFMHPDILKFINYAHKKNIGTLISTNFSFPFDKKKMEAIAKSELDILVVSLDGITPKVYNQYRVGGNFHQVVKNVKMLARVKSELNTNRPFIQQQFLVNKYNEHQIPKLKAFAQSIGADTEILEQTMIIFGQSNHDHISLDDWLPKNKKYRAQGSTRVTSKSENIPLGKCWWLWRNFALSHDGGISTCCYNNNKLNDFGNILKDDFKDIWNNEKYLSARALFKNEKGTIKTICHHCEIISKKGS